MRWIYAAAIYGIGTIAPSPTSGSTTFSRGGLVARRMLESTWNAARARGACSAGAPRHWLQLESRRLSRPRNVARAQAVPIFEARRLLAATRAPRRGGGDRAPRLTERSGEPSASDSDALLVDDGALRRRRPRSPPSRRPSRRSRPCCPRCRRRGRGASACAGRRTWRPGPSRVSPRRTRRRRRPGLGLGGNVDGSRYVFMAKANVAFSRST